MTRLAAALGEINMGHFIPDYTAYEELLGSFKGFVPIPILQGARSSYRIPVDELRREMVGRGLQALLCSNPCNPTGQLIEGDELAQWVELARECRSTLILDEFYSHYIYTGRHPDDAKMVSAAEYIEDVDRDPILIVDGLTKNWRYPGWRISWIVGPREVIAQATSAGSYLDGGANHPFQREALDLLDADFARQETRAIQTEFLRQARLHAGAAARAGRRGGSRAAGRLLRLGQPAPTAAAARRRTALLRSRPRREGRHRAGHVLRRQSRQAPGAEPLSVVLAVQLRTVDARARARPRLDRTTDPPSPLMTRRSPYPARVAIHHARRDARVALARSRSLIAVIAAHAGAQDLPKTGDQWATVSAGDLVVSGQAAPRRVEEIARDLSLVRAGLLSIAGAPDHEAPYPTTVLLLRDDKTLLSYSRARRTERPQRARF